MMNVLSSLNKITSNAEAPTILKTPIWNQIPEYSVIGSWTQRHLKYTDLLAKLILLKNAKNFMFPLRSKCKTYTYIKSRYLTS